MAGLPRLSQFDSEPPVLPEHTLVDALTAMLQATCHNNNATLNVGLTASATGYRSDLYPDGSSSFFFSLRRPTIHLRQYIARLVCYLHVSPSVFIVALVYLDRVHCDDALLALTDLNVHRLLTTALTVAAKFLEDDPLRNSATCCIGGVPSVKEMNMLEFQFLRRLQWKCSVSTRVYQTYLHSVLTAKPSFDLTPPPSSSSSRFVPTPSTKSLIS